jgi:hypothetical protein
MMSVMPTYFWALPKWHERNGLTVEMPPPDKLDNLRPFV